MSQLKALACRFYDEVLSGGNLDLIDELVHDDFVEHEAVPPGMPTDREAPRMFVGMMREGFPDVRATMEGTIEDGDTIVVRGRMSGTHQGRFMGIPPTGRRVDFAFIDIVRVSDGKAIEHWGVSDTMAMMQQLGVVPENPAG